MMRFKLRFGHAKIICSIGVNQSIPEPWPGGVFTFPYVPLISAAGLNFSNPYVLTYSQNGNPNDKPRPQLVTQNLHQFSRGQVFDNQQWSAFFGVLR